METPKTPEDWQLYTSKKGVGVAARSLTTALARLFKEADQRKHEGYGASRHTAGVLIEKHLRPIMEKYAKFGATDTEPRCVAYHVVEKYLGLY